MLWPFPPIPPKSERSVQLLINEGGRLHSVVASQSQKNQPSVFQGRRSPWLSGLNLGRSVLLGSALLALSSAAQAAPRVGQHDGFTRFVFTLPKTSGLKASTSGNQFIVTLNARLPAESGPLNAPGVSAYRVSGSTVSLTFAPGYSKAKASLLPSDDGQVTRLVIDVPAVAGVSAGAPGRTSSTRAVSRPKVVIDAGHGGVDPGMVSKWVTEKDVTLDVALRLRDLLQTRGVQVVLVRATDRHLSADKTRDLDARSDMAVTGEVAAYISIHVNAGNQAAQGIETYYFGKPIGGSNRSLAVLENGGGDVGLALTRKASNTAQNLLGDILAQAKLSFSQQLAQKVQYNLISATGAVNRGVHTDAFYVIRNPRTPAILTEIGFGSSPSEGPKLADPGYRQKIASGIAQALFSFLNVK